MHLPRGMHTAQPCLFNLSLPHMTLEDRTLSIDAKEHLALRCAASLGAISDYSIQPITIPPLQNIASDPLNTGAGTKCLLYFISQFVSLRHSVHTVVSFTFLFEFSLGRVDIMPVWHVEFLLSVIWTSTTPPDGLNITCLTILYSTGCRERHEN